MNRTDIAILILSLSGGGTEKGRIRLAGELATRGYNVDLLCVNVGVERIFDVPTGVRLIDLNSSRVIKSLYPLVKYLRKDKPRMLISALNQLSVVPIWAESIANSGAEIIASVHTNINLAMSNSGKLGDRILPYLVRRFFKKAKSIIAVSEGNAADLRGLTKLPDHKIKVIYDPVVTEELFAKANEPIDHPWLVEKRVPVIVGMAGRLIDAQDFPTLIRAFSIVRQKVDAKLIILGEGEERPNLEHLVKHLNLESDVDFPGFVKNPYAYLKNSSVFALTSKWQALPNAMIEALALEKQIVSTDCPSGPREILLDGEIGHLVPVGDFEQVAEALIKSMSLEFDAEKLKRRSYDFTLQKVTDEYLTVIFGTNE